MKKSALCEICEQEFHYYDTNRPHAKYCSASCRITSSKFWDRATEEEQIEKIRDTFERHVLRGVICWGWRSSTYTGYGTIKMGNKRVLLHRASWLIHIGPIPEGFKVKHSCGTKSCSNPEHLFLTV